MTRPTRSTQPSRRELVCIDCADPYGGDVVLGMSFARRRCKRCGKSVEMTAVVQLPAHAVARYRRAVPAC